MVMMDKAPQVLGDGTKYSSVLSCPVLYGQERTKGLDDTRLNRSKWQQKGWGRDGGSPEVGGFRDRSGQRRLGRVRERGRAMSGGSATGCGDGT
jgi:hypothetical protein